MPVLVFRLGVAGKAGGAETGSVQIKVDQVGYRPDGEKVAVTAARKRCRRRKITWMIRLRMRAMSDQLASAAGIFAGGHAS